MHAGIDFKVKTNVTSVDVKNKSLTTESGENITFEKLIVATGSRVSHSIFRSLLLIHIDEPIACEDMTLLFCCQAVSSIQASI